MGWTFASAQGDILAGDWYSQDSNAYKYVLEKLASVGEAE